MKNPILLLAAILGLCVSNVSAQQSSSPATTPKGEKKTNPQANPGWVKPVITEVAPGIWRLRFGTPEQFTPDSMRAAKADLEGVTRLPAPSPMPFKADEVRCRITDARTVVYVPCDEPDSQIYGFGLDPGAYEQKKLRKYLAVCAAVMGKTGASHGPVPFWLSTKGYGVFVDTARIPFVHVARLSPKDSGTATSDQGELKTSVEDLYAAQKVSGKSSVVVEIPGDTKGVDVYLFGGPTMREAVQRYNLFSGGGAMPPMWGLGMKYRTFTRGDKASVMDVAKAMREMEIPCDVIGLEPGWQTKAYSCSLAWSDERFPQHDQMITDLKGMGYKINLWEHAYIHPSSPLHAPLKDHSGDNLVWGGLVVDFADPKGSKIFSDYHGTELIDKGITGFKADECDNQPITDTTPFNFPFSTVFPSGIDGEQMIQLYGYLYQRSILDAFKERKIRTWGDVRATGSLAAPLPFNLYSDAYKFDEYLRQLVNSSFSGMLWSPEVRNAGSYDELLNRAALSSFASQMCMDMWFMPHPIWKQYRDEDNKAGRFLPEKEQKQVAKRLRDIVNLRYRLLPYLYAGFHRYHTEGLPPVRSLLLEFPGDKALRSVDDQFLFGDNLMVAPFMEKQSSRRVYLPKGCNWIELKTSTLYAGGQAITVSGEPGDVPLFVRENTILPWAEPVQNVGKETVFNVTMKVFGDHPAPFTLVEDDGETDAFERGEQNLITASWKDGKGNLSKKGNYSGSRYNITGWEKVATAAAPEPIKVREVDAGAMKGMSLISAQATYTTSSSLKGQSGSGRLLDAEDGEDDMAIHTLNEADASVVIDLKKVCDIAGLSILNRSACKPKDLSRAETLAVWLSDDGKQWRVLWEAKGAKPAWNLVLPTPYPARFVKIGLRKPNFLHLKRVRIYGR